VKYNLTTWQPLCPAPIGITMIFPKEQPMFNTFKSTRIEVRRVHIFEKYSLLMFGALPSFSQFSVSQKILEKSRSLTPTSMERCKQQFPLKRLYMYGGKAATVTGSGGRGL
jgi:hypothetical protein